VFGKRPADGDGKTPAAGAPPPAPKSGPGIATRPQRTEPATATQALAQAKPAERRNSAADRIAGTHTSQGVSAAGGPKATSGLEQLRAAQGAQATEIVREQNEYYHATKTTIFNALINTIDLAQLAQLDVKAAGEEIRDIVAELVAIKNVSMSVAEQEHLVQYIIN
jgi:pilus assembly protein CpaF